MGVDYTFEDTWTQPGNNGVDGRYHDGAFLAVGPQTNPYQSWRDGVLPSAYLTGDYVDLKIVPDSPTPSMSVRSYLGQSVISRAAQGPWISTLRSTARIDLDLADAANGRRDLVYAQVLDASIGDAETRTRLIRATGTPSSTPQLPPLPVGAIPLAEIPVAANATQITGANIIDLRKAAGIRGGIRLMLPGDSASDPGAYPGDARYRNGQVEVWGADGRWHGTVSKVYSQAMGAGTALQFASYTPMTLSIPDPGWPFQLETKINWHGMCGTPINFTVAGRLDTDNGALLTSEATYNSGGGSDGITTPANADLNFAPSGRSATLNGAYTIRLRVNHISGGAGTRTWQVGTNITATVIPV